jgi:hypothetical protein
MRYELDISEDVDRCLTEQANEAGQDKVHYLQNLIAQHVQAVMPTQHRRLPDLPFEADEIDVPFDLPRSESKQIVTVRSERTGTRLPDPLFE